VLTWPEGVREIYAKNFLSVTERSPVAGGLRGNLLRELHNAVFDAMASRSRGVIRVGVGSRTYAVVGAWAPRGLVAWMMGVRRVEKPAIVTPGSGSGSEGVSGPSMRISDHISIHP
jgi:hypothetical protein